MRDMRGVWLMGIVSACQAVTAQGGQALQPGFYSHEPDGVPIRITNVSSGPVCSDAIGRSSVCGIETRIVVTGQETCTGTDGKQYPCTRYGYQYDYAGAEPGEVIECRSTRKSAFRSAGMDYTLDLDAGAGRVFHPSWVPYEAVAQRTMLTEVHECTYRGRPLTTIEYLVSYEPEQQSPQQSAGGGPAPGIDEPYVDEVPDACRYLTEVQAGRLTNTGRIQKGAVDEHIGNLWSRCSYTSVKAPFKTIGYGFKFMLYDMFDVEKLSPDQLMASALFAAGGQPPSQRIDGLGKVSFVFEAGKATVLMVVTGIQGPADGASRPRELVATYQLEDPDRSHVTRLADLRAQAEQHLEEWHSAN
jgi:hypothetical protein